MTKKELVALIADKELMTRGSVASVLEALADIVQAELVRNKTFDIPRVGAFKVVDVAARKGRNPATGEAIDIPAKRKVTYKAVKTLRDAV